MNTVDVNYKLKEIWQTVLENEVDTNLDFFENGGDSFKATLLVAKIQKCFDVDIELGEILFNSKFNYLCNKIKDSHKRDFIIQVVEKQDYYHSSVNQKSMYILDRQFLNINNTYNLPILVEINGVINKDKLEKAILSVIQEEEILRTSFKLIGKSVVQVVHDTLDFKLEYIEENKEDIVDILKKFIVRFDLEKVPLLKAVLVKNNNKYYMFINIHHIISDGVSINAMLKKIAFAYKNGYSKKVMIQYKDFSIWQNRILDGGVIEKQKRYWVDMYKDKIQPLDLPTDYPRPSIKSFNGKRTDFVIDDRVISGLNELAKKMKSTLFVIMFAAFGVLLYKYTSKEDICIGTMSSGRDKSEIEDTLGMYINTLAVRIKPKKFKLFSEFLNDIKNEFNEVFNNQEYPFSSLVESIGESGDLSRTPLFDIGFLFQNMGNNRIFLEENISFNPYRYYGQGTKFDFMFEINSINDKLTLTVEYCTDLFKEDSIQFMVSHYLVVLNSIIDDPYIKIDDICLLSDTEEKSIIFNFNESEVNERYIGKSLVDLFVEQANKTPDKTAVVYGGKEMSYKELNEKSDSVAKVLCSKNTNSNSIAGILMKRSFETIIAIIGTLKAGMAFLPLDTQYPLERIEYMLNDCNISILIVDDSIADEYYLGREIINLNNRFKYAKNDFCLLPINENNLSYVIYTSGSTGTPKGVMIEHGALMNFIIGIEERIRITSGESIIALTSISFDIFILETLVPLVKGLKVIFADENERMHNKDIFRLIEENEVSMMQITPSRLRLLLNDVNCPLLGKLKRIMIGGEMLEQDTLKKLKSIFDGEIYNMYGPTETTIWSTVKKLDNSEIISIGEPLANTEIYILNEKNKIQPIGVVGELCIAGKGLARGYVNRQEETEKRFINMSFNRYSKLYKTGDLAKRLPNGEIVILGRIDKQVKVNGYRVELDEIKNNILLVSKIDEAIIVSHKDLNGVQHLCCYFVSREKIDIQNLKNVLSDKLPKYLIPSYFIQIDKIPLTTNGKVNYENLPPINSKGLREDLIIEPKTEIQKMILKIWEELLDINITGINNDFFNIGGNSILAIRFEVEMEKLGYNIDNIDIYAHRTIEDISNEIEKKCNNL